MPRKVKYERIAGRFYVWRLTCRNGVYCADGRSNRPKLGRHSLNTRDREKALLELQELDLRLAVTHGKADASLLRDDLQKAPTLEEGRRLYEANLNRPAVMDAPTAGTKKRYRAVLDKFVAFAKREGVVSWAEVTPAILTAYGTWLEAVPSAPRTEYLELTTLKQLVKFLVTEGHLPADRLIRKTLKKIRGTSTRCYTVTEVAAIVSYCAKPHLEWLRLVIVALVSTGTRIGELIQLRWEDVDFAAKVIHLEDDRDAGRPRAKGEQRSTKSGRARIQPLPRTLEAMLKGLNRRADGRVFHGPKGGKLKADTVLRTLQGQVLNPLAARFPAAPGTRGLETGTVHAFRHYHCSRLSASGLFSELEQRKLMGHQDSAMVMRYTHLAQEEMRAKLDAIDFVGDVSSAKTKPENPQDEQQEPPASSDGEAA